MTTTYALPSEGHARLESLVDRVQAHPGDMIDLREFRELQEHMDVRAVLTTLPEGLSEEDFAGILKLALLTECATETYGDAFAERARRFDAPWLGRFNEQVWVPDELTHHTPYKYILMNMGFAEGELDREIRSVQEIDFIHRGGDTPLHVTTFGIVQEYLTDNWHGLIATILKQASPEASYMATRIKRRETLHTMWYRDMVALQIEANPRLLPIVAEALLAFEMPGNTLVPHLQSRVPDWMPRMNADFDHITKELVRIVQSTLRDVRQTGELIVEIAAARGYKLGPISPRVVRAAANRLGGPGYGLIGEALLERVGLSYVFEAERGPQDSALIPYQGMYERARALLRSWVAQQIDFRLDVT
jgi:hypothetical protein